ncbi:MAG: RnfABCDGE type electron transport complex subunit B [Gammaproteobacteria bacterium]|nr:RnfABCDGE type electron transport complex subunit B [Gammaproteobacteria bacterium]
MQSLIDQIDDWLPQTQCAQCGYPRCRLYAAAIVAGTAATNRCPPGGDITLAALARLTGTPPRPLDPGCGAARPSSVAVIDEARCIGCALCIKACPVDAIVGAAKWLHTVLAAECTGCELCIAPCPVDCIDLRPLAAEQPQAPEGWRWPTYPPQRVARARRRAAARAARLATRTTRARQSSSTASNRRRIQTEIRDSVARVRRKRETARDPSAGVS